MNKGIVLFVIGLIMFMLGIYLSMNWIVIGTLLGVGGGIIMGISTYYSPEKD